MQNTPSYSRGTPEWELLFNLTNSWTITAEQNATLLQSNGSVYDVARETKYSVERIQETPRIVESSEKYDQKNHPRFKWLQEWLTSSLENQEWYDKNVWRNFDLVYDGIMMLWDIFEFEDETATPDNKNIFSNGNGFTYFKRYAAKKHAEQNRKRMVLDWRKYTYFLPWDNQNKSEFFQKVLWLTLAGCYYWDKGHMDGITFEGHYWSENSTTRGCEYLLLSKYNIRIDNEDEAFSFSLRCLKK